MLLKEHLRNADTKLTRISKLNEELSTNMEKELDIIEDNSSIEQYQYQINLLNEKIKRQGALLNAEKLKTIDSIREKNEVFEAYRKENSYLRP